MGRYMDKLPAVISCCFCCFLRAGSVLIGVVSFMAGIILAPNVSQTSGYWDLHGTITSTGTKFETTAQVMLGAVSIMLCIVSIFLIVGALCNVPKLLETYQWGALLYCATTVALYFALSAYCFAVHNDCFIAGFTLLIVTFVNVILTVYFVIVVNSLRMSMLYLNSSTMLDL